LGKDVFVRLLTSGRSRRVEYLKDNRRFPVKFRMLNKYRKERGNASKIGHSLAVIEKKVGID